MTTATIHHKIISKEGKGADITNHVLTSMEYLKLKLPNVRTYVPTLPPCGSTDWSVYPSSLDLPGTPLQSSCLENPMDGGASWAAVHVVSKKESDTTEQLHFHFSLSRIGEGNGNPLQCSCLENHRDGGAWWASVYGVAQSPTPLKRLSSSRE